MDVFLANEQGVPLDEPLLAALARHVLESEEVDSSAELSILFVGRDHIRRLNARYAGDDYATDVLAFPMTEDDEDDDPLMVGDVVVCPEVARDNAEKAGTTLERELQTLLVHGTLHLLGYDHQNDAQRAAMDKRTNEIVASFGSGGRPRPPFGTREPASG
ncbi:MAG TPA: rRNA maturation RNase YbeY [Actinomycetota bacterium]|nr:rRNA maturation RNase YbeY [Actinomycetota bacterium]